MHATKPEAGRAGHHAVRFYHDSAHLCLSVADFLADAARDRQPFIVIATPAHRRGIAHALKRRQIDIERLVAAGDALVVDADETLERFMVAGAPDQARFTRTAAELLARLPRQDRGVRAYGEMVDVLWRTGQPQAAIRLEVLWNNLITAAGCSLLCGYSIGHFYKETLGFSDVCDLHTDHEILGTGTA